MPPLELLIKFFLLLIIFQVNFSFNLLAANWRLSPELWSPNIFFLAMATKMVAAWSAARGINFLLAPDRDSGPSWDYPKHFNLSLPICIPGWREVL